MSDTVPGTVPTSSPSPTTSPTKNIILVVDDDVAQGRVYILGVQVLLHGFSVLFASSLEDAKQVLRNHGDRIVLVISDGLLSPSTETAADVMQAMDTHKVSAPFVLVSGDCASVLDLLPRPPHSFLTKGCGIKEIMDHARTLLQPN